MNSPGTIEGTDRTSPQHARRSGSSGAVILRRSLREVKRDDLADRAAALTYYGVLSIFPAVLVLVSILGIIGSDTAQQFLNSVRGAAPGDVADFLTTIVTQAQSSTGASGVAAVVGVLITLWSASRYVAAFSRASNAVYGVPEGRPLWKTLALRVIVTLAVAVLLVVCAVIVVVTGPIASTVGNMLGVGDTLQWIWAIAKWPVLVLMVALLFSLLFSATPNVKYGRFRLLTAGGVVAVVTWLVFSGLFAVYLAFSDSYSKVYGPLATAIVFLVWLWISNLAVLLGLEFDSERERQRVLRAGAPPDLEPYVHVRDHQAMERDERRRVEAAEALIPDPEGVERSGSGGTVTRADLRPDIRVAAGRADTGALGDRADIRPAIHTGAVVDRADIRPDIRPADERIDTRVSNAPGTERSVAATPARSADDGTGRPDRSGPSPVAAEDSSRRNRPPANR